MLKKTLTQCKALKHPFNDVPKQGRKRGLLLAAVIAVGLAGTNSAAAASADYYVHYTIAGPGEYASTTITVGASNGQALVRPNGACGMRFEYPEDADWLIPIYDDVDTHTQGHINVWLPSPNCSAWNNIVLEPDIQDADDVTFAPYGVPGTLRVLDAKAYWIDGSGDKLVYKFCCGKDYVYGNELKALDAQAPAELGAIKRLLRASSAPGVLTEQLAASEQTLLAISRQLNDEVVQRRTKSVDRLEASVRRLEDAALAYVNDALLSHQSCRNNVRSGDTVTAFVACDAALDAVEQARAALDTANTWLR